MLVDYNIERNEPKKDRIIPFIQFVLAIVFIQCLVFALPGWLTGAEAVDEEALRFRVVANSNTDKDQELKLEILHGIEPYLIQAMQSDNVAESMSKIESEILKTATAIAAANGETVNFARGQALFPPKMLSATFYPQNYYDAYVLTIGSGRGDNFWCALFPNVCYPEQKEEVKEEKPKFFVWEWLKNVFS